jgi:hypothetical protein
LARIATAAAVGVAVLAAARASAQVDDEPSAVSPAAGTIELYSRGTDGALWQRLAELPTWAEASSLGAKLGSGPRALVRDARTIDVFARGPAGEFLHRARTSGTWGAWETLDGTLASAPAAGMRRGLNYLDVAARATDNTIVFRSLVPGSPWSPWSSLGGATISAPSVVSYKPGFVHIFARATDGTLAVISWNGSQWSAWTSLGGEVTASPSAISDGEGRIDIFARGGDAAIHRISWRDATGWSAWSRVDTTPVSSGPAAVVLGPDHYALFARIDGDIVMNELVSGSWSGWSAVKTTPPPIPPPPPTACGHSVARMKNALRGKRRRTISYGGRVTITGQAQGPDRAPVAGALVHVLDIRAGSELGQVTAGPDGKFRIKVRPGISRTVRTGFQWASEGFFACGMSLSLKVRAGVRLSAPRHVRVRGRIRLSGRLLGGHIPPRGKIVELQGWARGQWQVFRTTRSSRSGRYRVDYRLRTGVRGILRIRARVRRERGYPYTLGYSRVVRVRVG